MDIPSLFMIPSAVSSGKVHSVFPNSTDADFQFNRDSDATRVNSEGLIERVGYYGNELVINGNFATNSNWNLGSGDWTISNNFAIANNSNNNLHTSDTVATSTGLQYKVTFELVGVSQGYVQVGLSGLEARQFNSDGTYTLNIVSDGNRYLYFRPFGFTGKLTNVSVKEITGDRARLNYEIEGGLVNTKPSLLLEPQSTNLITYSEDYTQSDWAKLSAGTGTAPIITSNYAISPDGTLNASRIVLDKGSGTTSGDYSAISDVITLSGDGSFSIYLKSNTGTDYIVSQRLEDDRQQITVTKDWKRFTFSASSLLNGTSGLWLRGGYGSDDYADLLVYGAQTENLSYATSLIPTNGSTQTRAGETCNGAGTSSILPSEEGILYCEIAALANDGTIREITISDGTTNNIVEIRYTTSSNNIQYVVRSGGTVTAAYVHNFSDATQFIKAALSYKANNFKMYFNGNLVAVDTSGAVPNGLNSLDFNWGGVHFFYGKTRDIRVYNTKEMTDSEVDILLTKITS